MKAPSAEKKISLTKLLPDGKISSVRAYKQDDKIILEPWVEIPAREVWLYENKAALKKVKAGLSQKGAMKHGSFDEFMEHVKSFEEAKLVRFIKK